MHLPVRTNPRHVDGAPTPSPMMPRTAVPVAPSEWDAIPPDPRSYADADPVVDLQRLRQLIWFPIAALRRRWRLALLIAGGVIAAAVLAVMYLPRTYMVESRILARRNTVMPALGNPRRTVPTESDAPTRLAAEAVMSRDNLIDIIRSNKLLDIESSLVSPLGQLRNWMVTELKGPRTEEERIDDMVFLLQKRMWVTAQEGDEGTVAIGIVWRDPQSALSIVTTAQQNFLERRHTSEISLIDESITILDRHVSQARQSIEEAMAQLRELPQPRGAADARIQLPVTPAPVRRSRAASEEITRLQGALAQTRSSINDLETARRQRVAALQTRLAELSSSYGPAHPDVAAAQQSLQALNVESPQLTTLRSEERAAQTRLSALGAPEVAGGVDVSVEPLMARAALERLARGPVDTLDDPRVTYARSRLKIATTNYEDLLDRRGAAQIELETARAAFDYRYTIVTPPQFPKRALSPNVPLLLAGGLVGAVALALFCVTALDVAGGRLLESWQVNRQLGLHVLGEVRQP